MKIRKNKEKIPYGIYCYGLNSNGIIRDCPNLKNGKCIFIRGEYDSLMLEDGCKECGLRETVPSRIIKRYVEKTGQDYIVYRNFKLQEQHFSE